MIPLAILVFFTGILQPNTQKQRELNYISLN